MMTADHDEKLGVEIFLKEQISAISSMSQGTAMNLGGLVARGVFPLMRVFSFLLPKAMFMPIVTLEGKDIGFRMEMPAGYASSQIVRPSEPPLPADIAPDETVPLIRLAWSRSGDKGNLFNVGIFARQSRFFPYIAAALSAARVAQWYAHLVDDPANPRVDRYLLPASSGLNFVVHNALGGGGTTCARIDTLAKTMAQILLEMPVPVSFAIAAELR